MLVDNIRAPISTLTNAIRRGLQGLLQMLMEEGQRHVCAFWAPAGTKDAEKKALVQQLLAADSTYPGGLRAYIRNAKQLLEASKRGLNPFEGCRVSVPEGETLSTADTETLERCERNGVRTAANCAFVLVAGGLGERLGYNGIKVRVLVLAWRCAAAAVRRPCSGPPYSCTRGSKHVR